MKVKITYWLYKERLIEATIEKAFSIENIKGYYVIRFIKGNSIYTLMVENFNVQSIEIIEV